jgi:hypothetical protein
MRLIREFEERLTPHGPRVIDARKAIELAARDGFFIQAG